ncbi:MAG: hypothetical protein K8R77_12660 [Anaerolineaceae bacterium]|nr:hypothetical protein [Anaerolineaceae bacterium]
MMKRLSTLRFPAWTFPLTLLFVCLLAFGVLAPQLGFYWDDWAKTAVNVLHGFSGYKPYYAVDRPFSGWTHILFVSLIGNQRVAWQFFNLLLRWAAGVSMWWFFSRLWPQARRQVALASLLFIVYPVFTQQPITVTFHQQWLQYSLYFLSLGAMVAAIRNPKRYWSFTLISLALTALQLTVTEYFVGVLLIQPLIIWMLVGEYLPAWKPRLIETIRRYAVYLAAFAGYVVWRMFLMPLPGNDPYRASTLFDFFNTPLQTALEWGKIILSDTLYILVGSWAPVFDLGLAESIPPFTAFSWAAATVCAALLIFFLWKLRLPELQPSDENRWVIQAVVIGLAAVLLGSFPAWAIGRQVIGDFHANRYALPGMFGASLITVALLTWFSRSWRQSTLLVAVLASLCIGFQLRVSNEFRWAWADQHSFYWQLYWRAPHLEPGTAIFFETEPFPDQGLFSTSAALNLLYPQKTSPEEPVAYWAYTLYPRFNERQPNPEGDSLNAAFRSFYFEGSTTNSIFVHFDPQRSNCWWFLGPEDSANPYLSDLTKRWLSLTNFDRIKASAPGEASPSLDLFGPQPEQGWCYLYQKADLARQNEDWQQAADLGNQALAQGFYPNERSSNVPREWLPFIEAYTNTNQWERAAELTLSSSQQDPKYGGMLCNLWSRLTPTNETDLATRQQVFDVLGCGP